MIAKDAHKERQDKYHVVKTVAFVIVGAATLFYSLGELGVGIWYGAPATRVNTCALTRARRRLHALVLLSDGFHNLSDFMALAIGLWAANASRKQKTAEYSYGWARTELLGALVNSVFLLSLSLYILLEAVPRFIIPEAIDPHGFIFIIFSAVGVSLNIIGGAQRRRCGVCVATLLCADSRAQPLCSRAPAVATATRTATITATATRTAPRLMPRRRRPRRQRRPSTTTMVGTDMLTVGTMNRATSTPMAGTMNRATSTLTAGTMSCWARTSAN